MSGVNQDEREFLRRIVPDLIERQHGHPVLIREMQASIQCDGCGFSVVRHRDPDGPLPRWERTPDGRHFCPNCA
jgi:hypothetical protein